jgi:hypothetical protein
VLTKLLAGRSTTSSYQILIAELDDAARRVETDLPVRASSSRGTVDAIRSVDRCCDGSVDLCTDLAGHAQSFSQLSGRVRDLPERWLPGLA